MNRRQPRFSKEEAYRRFTEWYFKSIRPKLGPEHKGKYVAIDLVTGDHEISDDDRVAADALRARKPDADIFMHQIGYRASVSFAGPLPEDPAW